MKTITGTANAYLTAYSHHDADSAVNARPDEFSFWRKGEKVPTEYTFVGNATITIELIDRETIISNKVDALHKTLAEDRAESEVRQNRILEQISKLSAITYEVAA